MARSCTKQQLQHLEGLPAAEFLLHRKPMLLVDKLIEAGPEFAVCEWTTLPGDAFWVPGLGVPAYIGIEYMAQCVAVHAGACEKALGFPPPVGMLLGTRNFKSDIAYFEEGKVYQSRCEELLSGSSGVAIFACNITCEGRIIVAARLSVWQLKRGEGFNE